MAQEAATSYPVRRFRARTLDEVEGGTITGEMCPELPIDFKDEGPNKAPADLSLFGVLETADAQLGESPLVTIRHRVLAPDLRVPCRLEERIKFTRMEGTKQAVGPLQRGLPEGCLRLLVHGTGGRER